MVTCPICKHEKARRVCEISHTLYQCEHCSLIYSDRAAQETLADFYRDDEDGFFDREYFKAGLERPIKEHPEYPNYREALNRLKPKLANARLLDVGCGAGLLLDAARTLGFKPEGLEVSEKIAQRPARSFPVHLYDGRHQNFPNLSPFEIVTLWDVLEHVSRPVEFLASLRRLIKPGGRLVLRTINEDCLLAQFALTVYRLTPRFLGRPVAQRMHEPYHVIYFNQDTLKKCLETAGYKIEESWLGEYPAERVSKNPMVRAGLNAAYWLQTQTSRNYEQYVIARPI